MGEGSAVKRSAREGRGGIRVAGRLERWKRCSPLLKIRGLSLMIISEDS
jgi:hypothetical protein